MDNMRLAETRPKILLFGIEERFIFSRGVIESHSEITETGVIADCRIFDNVNQIVGRVDFNDFAQHFCLRKVEKARKSGNVHHFKDGGRNQNIDIFERRGRLPSFALCFRTVIFIIRKSHVFRNCTETAEKVVCIRGNLFRGVCRLKCVVF